MAVGAIALDESRALARHAAGVPVLLVRRDAETDDLAALEAAAGLLTQHGARTSHAAVVARQLGKVCLVGCAELQIDEAARAVRIGDTTLREGELLTRDGHEGARRLAEVRERAAPAAPSTEAVIGAFLDPILNRLAHAGAGWHSYFALIAYVNNSPEWGRKVMGKTFDATVRRFIQAVMDSLPGAAPEDIFWGYNFLTGALTLSLAETGRLDALSDGLCRSSDVAALKSRLGPYVAAGLRHLAGSASRGRG